MDKLENFLSVNGARFYGLRLNEEYITLSKEEKDVPEKIIVNSSEPVIPLRAGGKVKWSVSKEQPVTMV